MRSVCKNYKFVMEEEVSSSVTKRIGAFEEQSDLFEGKPSFKQKESKLQDGVFLFFDINSGEWRVSQGKTGRISEQATPVLTNAQNTNHPPKEGWQLNCPRCDQNNTIKLVEGSIKPCEEVRVELRGDTKGSGERGPQAPTTIMGSGCRVGRCITKRNLTTSRSPFCQTMRPGG